jgi:hypothetical protein
MVPVTVTEVNGKGVGRESTNRKGSTEKQIEKEPNSHIGKNAYMGFYFSADVVVSLWIPRAKGSFLAKWDFASA